MRISWLCFVNPNIIYYIFWQVICRKTLSFWSVCKLLNDLEFLFVLLLSFTPKVARAYKSFIKVLEFAFFQRKSWLNFPTFWRTHVSPIIFYAKLVSSKNSLVFQCVAWGGGNCNLSRGLFSSRFRVGESNIFKAATGGSINCKADPSLTILLCVLHLRFSHFPNTLSIRIQSIFGWRETEKSHFYTNPRLVKILDSYFFSFYAPQYSESYQNVQKVWEVRNFFVTFSRNISRLFWSFWDFLGFFETV